MSSHSRRLFFKQGAALLGATLLVPKTNAANALVKGVQHIDSGNELLVYHSHNLQELVAKGSLSDLSSLLDAEPGYGLLMDTGGLFSWLGNKEIGREVNAINSLRLKASLLGAEYLKLMPEKLPELLLRLDFPLVNCNYKFKDNRCSEAILPYVIYKTKRKTIGITGVGSMTRSSSVEVEDPIAAANRVATYLKTQKACDLVICLTELDMDRRFAERSSAIDLILGASEANHIKETLVLGNSQKEEVILSSAGQEFLSKSTLVFNADGQRIGFDHRHLMCSDPYARNAEVMAKIKSLQADEAAFGMQGLLG